MPLEEDVLSFAAWANRLAFPMEDMPSEEALKSIFKSRQSLLFFNIIEKVRPRKDVSEIRKNILLHKMEKLKDQIVPTCTRSFLPREMQLYLKIKDLNKEKTEAEGRVNEVKSEVDSLSSFIKTKNVEKLRLKQKQESLETKVNILELKSESLVEEISKEIENKDRAITYMPTKINSSNASESKANEVLVEAIKELEKFYQIFLSNSDGSNIQEAKETLWKTLRRIFTNIPNYLLWTSILKQKDDQLQNISSLNKTSVHENTFTGDKLSAFDIQILKIQTKMIHSFTKFVAAKKEGAISDKRFMGAYEQFVSAVQQKVSQYHFDATEDVEEIISDFLVEYNKRSYNKSQIDALTNEIEICKFQVEEANRVLKDHVVLLGSIKQMYAEIEGLVCRIEQEMAQLNQIKEKILYSKSVLQYTLNDIKNTQTSFNMSKIKMMGSSMDSFNISDNALCSTKLDFFNSGNTTMRGDITMINTTSSLPQHVLEISTFIETPIERLSCLTKECKFYLSPNPLALELSQSISTIQLAPGLLLTSDGAIQEVKNKCDWDSKLREISTEVKPGIAIVDVDLSSIKNRKKEQREQITELLDKIEVTGINTKRTLGKCSKYYNFLLKNPLRKFIPESKLFNNQSYADYESEYQMYYRMATSGGSLNN